MRPQPFATMAGTVAYVNRIELIMLSSTAGRNCSIFVVAKFPAGGPPALQTTMSGSPRRPRTLSRSRSISSDTDMSLINGTTSARVWAAISFAACSTSACVRALIATRHPSAASASAEPRPSALDAAVTSASCP